MCLLVVVFHAHPDAPLVIAANRDENMARPSVAMSVLRQRGPRVLGGQDLVAGGTWLATNEHGLVAGLTNLPSSQVARDPSKRSRGELPLLFAAESDIEIAVERFLGKVRPQEFNASWMMVGDRRKLFYIDVTGTEPVARALGPGIHVLENKPLDVASAKADFVRCSLAGIEECHGERLTAALQSVLSSHAGSGGQPESAQRAAPCVHRGQYGTRSSAIITVPREPAMTPSILFTEGPPCTSAINDGSYLWESDSMPPASPMEQVLA